MSGYSQKDDAQKISKAIEVALNQARSLGGEAYRNGLDWGESPFKWDTQERRVWSDGYSDAEVADRAKQAS